MTEAGNNSPFWYLARNLAKMGGRQWGISPVLSVFKELA
jgi:hypothetical protein